MAVGDCWFRPGAAFATLVRLARTVPAHRLGAGDVAQAAELVEESVRTRGAPR